MGRWSGSIRVVLQAPRPRASLRQPSRPTAFRQRLCLAGGAHARYGTPSDFRCRSGAASSARRLHQTIDFDPPTTMMSTNDWPIPAAWKAQVNWYPVPVRRHAETQNGIRQSSRSHISIATGPTKFQHPLGMSHFLTISRNQSSVRLFHNSEWPS